MKKREQRTWLAKDTSPAPLQSAGKIPLAKTWYWCSIISFALVLLCVSALLQMRLSGCKTEWVLRSLCTFLFEVMDFLINKVEKKNQNHSCEPINQTCWRFSWHVADTVHLFQSLWNLAKPFSWPLTIYLKTVEFQIPSVLSSHFMKGNMWSSRLQWYEGWLTYLGFFLILHS